MSTNDTICGINSECTVIGQVAATDADLALLASYLGEQVSAEDVAVVEMVPTTTARHDLTNTWILPSPLSTRS